MKTFAPDYYNDFKCIMDKCRHTCCVGWEIDIDRDSLEKYKVYPEIMDKIDFNDVPHFKLECGRCPFLRQDNLCQMILDHGEDFICQICTDHPRFRNFWTGRTEIGLGLVCEEAARIILLRDKPMKLEIIDDDGKNEALPEDEAWLMKVRQKLFDSIYDNAETGNGPDARLLEYLIYRHIADALYDDRLEERIRFVQDSYDEILDEWENTDGTIESLIECARKFSVEKEYIVQE